MGHSAQVALRSELNTLLSQWSFKEQSYDSHQKTSHCKLCFLVEFMDVGIVSLSSPFELCEINQFLSTQCDSNSVFVLQS